MVKDMDMPSVEGGVLAIITKYGWLKAATLGAALGGAAIMAIFRPPKTRKEMFTQGAVAIGTSLLFGDAAHTIINGWFPLDYVAVHGLVGSLSWGFFGGLATLRDKFATDPVQTVKDVKDIV